MMHIICKVFLDVPMYLGTWHICRSITEGIEMVCNEKYQNIVHIHRLTFQEDTLFKGK